MQAKPGDLVKCLPMTFDQIEELAKDYMEWSKDKSKSSYPWYRQTLGTAKKDLTDYLGRNTIYETYEVLQVCVDKGNWPSPGYWPRLVRLGKPGSLYPIDYLEVVFSV